MYHFFNDSQVVIDQDISVPAYIYFVILLSDNTL